MDLGDSWPFGTLRMGDQRGKGDLLLVVTRVLPRISQALLSFSGPNLSLWCLFPDPAREQRYANEG